MRPMEFVTQAAMSWIALAAMPAAVLADPDPLSSWNDGSAKEAITDFVVRVTTEGSADFVPAEQRIAVFDNDGTLWSEQPIYFQAAFAFDRVRAMAPEHPEWKTTQPFKSILDNDMETLAGFGEKALVQIVTATHAGMTVDAFHGIVRDWLEAARHPRFNRPYADLVYRPMRELLAYLGAHDFRTFVVSGGGIEFMRSWMEIVHGIPPEQVIGSSGATKFKLEADGTPVLVKLPEVEFIDEAEGKPVAINRFIGRRPILAFGNSDGDLQMLQWTTAGPGARFAGIVHHTDAEREWAYDRHSKIGRLDKALDEGTAKGWTVVDMKRDWKRVFAFEP